MRGILVVVAVVAVGILVGCRHAPPAGTTDSILITGAPVQRPITWKRAETADDVPRTPPQRGAYRVHLIDVGTGLAVLVQGADFAMLFDAGSNDRDEKPSRVIDYLTLA